MNSQKCIFRKNSFFRQENSILKDCISGFRTLAMENSLFSLLLFIFQNISDDRKMKFIPYPKRIFLPFCLDHTICVFPV
jgi:hypothetical protein